MPTKNCRKAERHLSGGQLDFFSITITYLALGMLLEWKILQESTRNHCKSLFRMKTDSN